MKYLIIFSLVALLATGALAEEVYFKDVPEGHWASSAVYELVRMGVTSGYPDGTFRGKKDISRFEIAAFLSKFAKYYNLRRSKDEKLIEELRAETALIKYQREKTARATQFFGSLSSQAMGSTLAPRGGKLDYRLRLNLVRNFAGDSSFKVGLDTLDAGFNNAAARSLTTEQ
ncbi:MAG: S-layer homology domain-containing protein, partial [Candidatus Margulisiibacteriota bacterium]